ncbi:PREDICTED: ribosomal L1 domain-containing protein CG13096-like [Polistes canadensis]|uniref:ribosomal L1 domain-containing protein CG13096-like n=1 Tax=Polistes canadensis TaxID=91411 RepID=UPI000718DE35|nr:PREDICTED: ribosomal L1 domain-containing protein CG13096-like [Polistes canadensis]
MESLKHVTKKRKALNDDVSNIFEDKIKERLNSKCIENNKKIKFDSVKKKKKFTGNSEIIQNNTENAKEKRKSLPEMKKAKKLKLNSDTTIKKQKAIIIEDIEVKSNGDDINLKDLSKEHIQQCILAIFHLTKEQLKDTNVLFSDEYQPIFMQVTCIRIPQVPRRQVRILLPNSVVSSEDDIALIVCDLEKGRRKDYEPTVNYYKELLEKCGCTKIKDIIPMNQLKTEYDQYELKRKLVASYDHFLVDGRIAGHVSHLLGKIFYNKRKLPTSVKMDKKDLKSEIDYALRKTSMRLHSLADTHVIQVANTSMKKKHILDNVLAVCNQLTKTYPGGWSNIRAIRLKTPIGLGFPIYMTLKNKNTVYIPVVKPKRPKAYCNVEGELTTLSSNANVVVTPEGNVIVKKTSSKEFEDKKRKNKEEESIENNK